MASASSSVRESFNFPATFTVTSHNPDPTSQSYSVVFSNRTWGTSRFNPQGTSASVAEQQEGSLSATQRTTTITVNNIFRLNWVNAIKSEKRNFSFLTGQDQLSTLKEVINGTRSIIVDLGNPAELVLSTLKPRTDEHATITRFISESLASVATSSALPQIATASSASLAGDDTTLKQQSAGAGSATNGLSNLSLVDTSSLPIVSSTEKDDSASASTQTAAASSASLATNDTTLRQQGAETRSATDGSLDFSLAGTMLPPRRQRSTDSDDLDVTYHTPTATSTRSSPSLLNDMPPPPPSSLNSVSTSSGIPSSKLDTPGEAANNDDDDVLDNLPPPPPADDPDAN